MRWFRASCRGRPWVAALLVLGSSPWPIRAEIVSLDVQEGAHGPPAFADGEAKAGLVVAYVARTRTGTDIHAWPAANRSKKSAGPTNGVVVCSAPGDQLDPVATSDGLGGFFIAWVDTRGRDADIYSQHILASGIVDPAWPEQGLLICGEPGFQTGPRIVSDGEGGAVIAWDDARSEDPEVYLQRVLASGKLDASWPPAGARPSTLPHARVLGTLLPDGSGGAVLSWTQYREGPGSDILIQHILATGKTDPRWPEDGSPVCNQSDEAFGPVIADDGAGGTLVAWTGRRHGGVGSIYARRILPSGEADPRWPEKGLAVSATLGGQRGPSLTADGAGGAYIAWQDARVEASESIFLQHVTGTGAIDPGWPEDGLLVSSGQGLHVAPRVLSLGGNLIMAWLDRTTLADVRPRAHRVFQDGRLDPAWPRGGAVLSSSEAEDLAFVSINGCAAAAWRDAKTWAIRTTCLAENSPPIEELLGRDPVAVTELMAPRPNPARDAVQFHFSLASRGPMRLDVYDLAGRRVAVALQATLDAGPHNVTWDRTGPGRRRVQSGIYFVRFEADGVQFTRRFALVH